MATFRRFEDMEVWLQARHLTKDVYSITRHNTFSKDFSLCDQIRRASVSIMSNIAEGFERDGTREFIQFLSIAKGSCGEVKTHLYVAFDQMYITEQDFQRLYSTANSIGSMIGKLIIYLQKSGIKGSKYKVDMKPETRNKKQGDT